MSVASAEFIKNQTFLVYTKHEDLKETFVKIMSPLELCSLINMNDIYNLDIDIYRMTEKGKLESCHYKGWQPNCLIEVVNDKNQTVLYLYGEDH